MKLTSDSQSAHDDPTRNSGGQSWEQGVIRAQSQRTLTLKRSSNGETEPTKATYHQEGRDTQRLNLNPTSLELCIPPSFEQRSSSARMHSGDLELDNGKEYGVQVVELATPKGTKQSNSRNE